MDKIKELLATRKELLNVAQTLVAEGKFEEFTAKEAEIKELDARIEAAELAYTNLQALQDNNRMTDLSNFSIAPKNAEPVGQSTPVNVLTTDKLYENAFAKAMMGMDMTQQENSVFMEINNHTTDNSSVMIPKTTLNEVISEFEKQNPFYADVRKLQIKGNVALPRHKAILSGDAKAYLEVEETETEVNEEDEIQLGAKEIAKYIEISFKLESMSIPGFLTYLKEELVDRLGVELGRQVINGDGVKELTGVLTAMKDVTSQHVSYPASGMKYVNMTEAFSKLGERHVGKAVIYASNDTVWNVLANILGEDGRPIFIKEAVDGGVGRIFGCVVKADGGVPKGTIIIGNAKGYALNENLAVSVESERNLKKRKTGFSGYTIQDGNVTHEKAFVIVTPAA